MPALIALLDSSEQFIMADLYTFTLVGGAVLRYSAAPTALTVNGQTFALGPKFERSKTKVVIGVQVDELEVKVYPDPTDLIGDLPFLEAAWQGQLDGALLQLERAFMPTYGDTSPGNRGSVCRPDLGCRLQPYRHRHEMPLASRITEYPDASSALAILLHAHLWRADVPI